MAMTMTTPTKPTDDRQADNLGELNAHGLVGLRAIILRVIDDGKPDRTKGARPDAALPWCFYPSNQFWRNETAGANVERLDFCDAIQQAIVDAATPATRQPAVTAHQAGRRVSKGHTARGICYGCFPELRPGTAGRVK